MGKYEEEIYDRAEKKFGSIEEAEAWLAGFDKPKKNKAEKEGYNLYLDVKNLNEINREIQKAKDYDEFRPLRKLAKSISNTKIKAKVPDVDTKMKEIAKEMKELKEKNIAQKLEEERLEKLQSRVSKTQGRISSASRLSDINRIEDSLRDAEREGANVSQAMDELTSKRVQIEETKIAERIAREEEARLAAERKEEMIARGRRPEF